MAILRILKRKNSAKLSLVQTHTLPESGALLLM